MTPMPGSRDFESRLLPKLLAIPFFRAPTDPEVDASYAAYSSGDFAHLCEVWKGVASAQRSILPPGLQRGYDHAGLLPTSVNAHVFLASVRAALAAGVRFRAGLTEQTRESIHRDFPWLENRHLHIPAGWTPQLEFLPEFAEWIDVPSLESAKARWQLATGLNEVQQAHNSEDCARRFRIPELRIHAARERELASNYFSHWAPLVTRELFRECLFVLDGLNAAVFAMLCRDRPAEMVGRSILGAISRRSEWKAFVAALAQPQLLVTPPAVARVHGA